MLDTDVASLTPREKAEIAEDAHYMALAGEPRSDVGRALVARVMTSIVLPSLPPQQRRPSSLPHIERAAGAMLADLLTAASARAWCLRSLDDHSFTGLPVRRRQFRKVLNALNAGGYLQSFAGYTLTEVSDAADWPDFTRGRPLALRASEKLIALAEAGGIGLKHVRRHFDRGRPVVPANIDRLIVRKATTRTPEGRKVRGAPLPIDLTTEPAKGILQRIEALNAYLFTKEVDGIAFAGLRRIFSNGDQPGFNWQWGGRFYSLPGGDRYENMPSATRAERIRINGEETVEVDISAAHLTILYALRGLPFDPSADPYDIPGCGRVAVKRWLTVSLGKGSTAARGKWYSRVREETMKVHPVLEGFDSYGISTHDLQYHESEILLNAMAILRIEHDIPSLPLHDGLIVGNSKAEKTREVLSAVFHDYLRIRAKVPGVYPRIH